MQLSLTSCSIKGYIGVPCLNFIKSTLSDGLTVGLDLSQYISEHLNRKDNLVVLSSDITLNNRIEWHSSTKLTLISKSNITFTSLARVNTSGTLELKAGIESPRGEGTVIFEGKETQIETGEYGKVVIQYNPNKGEERHKYHNPYPYSIHVSSMHGTDDYMLVNNAQDLQDIRYMLHFEFALSQDIKGPLPNGKRFSPITVRPKGEDNQRPFSGALEGNGYMIKDLDISFPGLNDIGLFSRCGGTRFNACRISNIEFENITITGKIRAAVICPNAQSVEIKNVIIRNCAVSGENVVGGAVGATVLSKFENITIENTILSCQGSAKGFIAGAAMESEFAGCIEKYGDAPLIGEDMETNLIDQCEA